MFDYNTYDYNYKILTASHNISAYIPVLREGTISWETVVACNKFFKSSVASLYLKVKQYSKGFISLEDIP